MEKEPIDTSLYCLGKSATVLIHVVFCNELQNSKIRRNEDKGHVVASKHQRSTRHTFKKNAHACAYTLEFLSHYTCAWAGSYTFSVNILEDSDIAGRFQHHSLGPGPSPVLGSVLLWAHHCRQLSQYCYPLSNIL